ncbi:hypothetical protein GGR52DRAFT_592228 [Hypoxylon sp. FL1284]|nr:hypothetical protein GGR52DRAFT_592228 [Hypoxylon sp. FL1284]
MSGEYDSSGISYGAFIGGGVFMVTVSWLFVGMKLAGAVKQHRGLYKSDYAAIISAILLAGELATNALNFLNRRSSALAHLQFALAGSVVGGLSAWATKVPILLQYVELFGVKPRIRTLVWSVLATTFLVVLAGTIYMAVNCSSTPTHKPPAHPRTRPNHHHHHLSTGPPPTTPTHSAPPPSSTPPPPSSPSPYPSRGPSPPTSTPTTPNSAKKHSAPPSARTRCHMLDHSAVPVSLITPNCISQWATQPLVDALLARGWDVAAFGGRRLLDAVVRARRGGEELARWLAEDKGAAVDCEPSDEGDDTRARPPPVLETCAAFGSVGMFEYLEERGARFGRRVLHEAVQTAAERGADPGCEDPARRPDGSARNAGVEMLRYLVDERRLDVNAVDADRPPQNLAISHWGTPICYAASCPKGAPVVRWLLKKGADPTLRSPYSRFDAPECARLAKCDESISVLEEWQRTRNQGDESKASDV